MSLQAANRLRECLSQFLEAPTKQRQDALMSAADEYRELWIEVQAAQKPDQQELPDAGQATTRYRRIHSVLGRQPDGTEITVALQSRTSLRDGKTWNVVSWRSRLGPGGYNRRFYVTKDDAWTVDARTALEMLSKLEQLGGLDDKYSDQRKPDFIVTVSDDIKTVERSSLLGEITMPDEDWGKSPFFVVLNDPHGSWRKILIVDRQSGRATFRSTTTDESYMPRKTMRPGSAWYLDNSMQDTNVQQARVLLAQLRRIVASVR